jgi:hypothetical protein
MKFDMQKARRYADTGDLMKTTKWLYHALDEIDRQAKRIAELEGNLVTSGQNCQRQFEKFQLAREKSAKQRVALKKLGKAKRARGKALVEERANLIESGGETTRQRLLKEDEDDLYDLARAQLHQEGKL